MKVVLDTNVLVAAVAARGACAQLLEHVLTHHELAIDGHLLAEVDRVLRDKIRVPEVRVAEFTSFLRSHAEVLESGALPHPVCRDPDDDRVLALCRACAANVLVTGDADLPVLDPWEGIRIVLPRDFWRFERMPG